MLKKSLETCVHCSAIQPVPKVRKLFKELITESFPSPQKDKGTFIQEVLSSLVRFYSTKSTQSLSTTKVKDEEKLFKSVRENEQGRLSRLSRVNFSAETSSTRRQGHNISISK